MRFRHDAFASYRGERHYEALDFDLHAEASERRRKAFSG